ncbi:MULTISPECIES: MarR family winged helix-turn-helix transcriptional regulator [Dietzia]|uniref:MarR family winged helix-turn-helix transcriptional regulator n=1 Tax=Dietzia TaxID=37914 RepID=UPI0020C4E6A7|nr:MULTISPECIES: MarR family transcriptional regulator [Dietzia]MCT1710989.1 MarR family transcriptional regulator [Dietzia cinnamea]MCT2264679.1 MarR family transcriptional regulator [Dietzia cinnamea]MCT2273539.1 MarR family transcriptional regulator [Dietzia cinnamea]
MSQTRWLSDDEQRMWRRYRDANQLLELAMERQLQRDASMSQSDYSVLVSLSEGSEQGLRARELGAALGWDRSRVSHQVRRMEGRGLVAKGECPEDGRGTVVTLTEAGAQAIAAVAPKHVEKVRELFIDELTPEEVGMLTDIFERVVQRVGKVDGITLPR